MVSVIIPNYCHERYLTERIESVLAQTYTDFEVIILDDLSKDNSREVIERYRTNPHVSHIVYNEENSGSTFRQWEKGFALAKGEYIWIAESDDVAHPDFLKECVPHLDEDPEVSFVFSDCEFIDSDSNHLAGTHTSGALRRGAIDGVAHLDGNEFIRCFLTRRNCVTNASMALLRKSALPTDKRYMSYRYVGDWFFWMLMALDRRVVFVNKWLDRFRIHGTNTTKQSMVRGAAYMELWRMMRYMLVEKDIVRKTRISPWRHACIIGRYTRLAVRRCASDEAFVPVYKRWRKAHPMLTLYIAWFHISQPISGPVPWKRYHKK